MSERMGVRGFARKLSGALLFIALVGFVSIRAQAPTGSILGAVKDSTGGVLSGATVTALNTETGVARPIKTGDDGAYRLDALPVGHYDVKAEQSGFKTVTQKGIVLDVSQQAEINFTLEVGSASQEVVVTGEAPLVNTTNSALGGLVDEQKMAELPLNGRNYLDLTLLQPGVSASTAILTLGGGTQGTVYSSNGAPVISNNFLLDGAPTQTIFGYNGASANGSSLGVDGIREYKVVTNAYAAEYGMTMGSQMLIVSKGGSNQWHGDVFEYLRNSSMDAANFFDTTQSINGRRLAQYARNNFGGAFGGPIKKDKTFFYAVYEGLREAKGISSNLIVPPASCHPAAGFGSTTVTAAPRSSFKEATGTDASFPSVDATCTGQGPVSVNPTMQNILALFPIPNNGANIFSWIFDQPTRVDHGQIRVDQNITDKDALFARYTIDDSFQTLAGPNYFPQFNDLWSSRAQYITLAENHIFSPAVLNSIRVSYSRTNLITGFTYDTSTSDQAIVPNDPRVVFNCPTTPCPYIVGNINIFSGLSGFGPDLATPNVHLQNYYTLSDDLFYTKGKHAFKFGLLINRPQGKDSEPTGRRGTLSFASLSTFLTNSIVSESGETPGSLPNKTKLFNWFTYGVYAQDDWRITPRLTLNLGLRYEINTIPVEVDHSPGLQSSVVNLFTDVNAVVTTPAAYACLNAASPSCSGGNVITNIDPNIKIMNNPSFRNFSPRIGFAWDLFGDGKTSIRGAAGIYYDIASFGQGLLGQTQQYAPYSATTTLSPALGVTSFVPGYFQSVSAFANPVAPGFPGYGPALSISGVSYHTSQPTIYQWNFSVDRQLPGNMALTVSYVGTRGIHLWNQEPGDECVPMAINNGVPNWINTQGVGGSPVQCPLSPLQASLPYNTAPTNGRFNPKFGNGGNVQNTIGESWYEGLQVSVNRKLQHGLQMQMAYTYSKSLDTGQGQMLIGTQPNTTSYNLLLDKGVSQFDATHNLRYNLLYHLPSPKSSGVLAKVLGGWWTGNIISAQSGYPFTPVISSNRELNNSTATGVDYPNFSSTFSQASVITRNISQWYVPSMFALPAAGTIGNVPRDFLRGPRLFDWDFSINKDTKLGFLGEAGMLEFRAELFNILNHPNFDNPNFPGLPTVPVGSSVVSSVGATGFGSNPCPSGACQITGALIAPAAGQIITTSTGPRDIQLALKVIF